MGHYFPSQHFTRPEILSNPGPYVVAELDYATGGIEEAASYWQSVIDTVREKEPGKLHYGIVKDAPQESSLTLSEDTKKKNRLVSLRCIKALRTRFQSSTESAKAVDVKHYELKIVGGFLHK
ncbi:hypothetical protein IL306_007991 [Fusarium sp. DS 682]|nr:hypothetical protein IL306_007991 [Fusarium sp. DS 682]